MPTAKYKAGQYVQISSDIQALIASRGLNLSTMLQYAGQIFKIEAVSKYYGVCLEGNPYVWDENILLPIEDNLELCLWRHIAQNLTATVKCFEGMPNTSITGQEIYSKLKELQDIVCQEVERYAPKVQSR